jgi:segregation and condensation protein B
MGWLVETKALLEAILFVAENPVPASELAEVTEVTQARIVELLGELATDLDTGGRGLTLREVGGGWRLYAHPDAFSHLERYAASPTASKLSGAALETLAVVAYRQPVSRGQVAEIRGVDSDSSLRTLERRGLVREIDRLPLPGNPATYGTSELFLEKLGLRSLADLPPLADHVPPREIVETLEDTFRPDSA